MANAGESSDCRLLTKLIKEGKTLPHRDEDSYLDWRIKHIMNKIVESDKVTKSYCPSIRKKTIIHHSAWSRMHKALIKINQIRQKNMYYTPLVI